jgi:hypothetical protein
MSLSVKHILQKEEKSGFSFTGWRHMWRSEPIAFTVSRFPIAWSRIRCLLTGAYARQREEGAEGDFL